MSKFESTTEVCNAHLGVAICVSHQDIIKLDVPMYDIGHMEALYSHGHLPNYYFCVIFIKWQIWLFFEIVKEITSRLKFCGDVYELVVIERLHQF